MNNKIIEKYKSMNLEVETGSVEPDFYYPKHHHGTTCMFITNGSVTLQRESDSESVLYRKGDEFVVQDGEFHWGQAGADGYSYIAGWNQDEYQKYPEDQWY